MVRMWLRNAWPRLILPFLVSLKRFLAPELMVVAGDHANNDMAGDDDDSWKSMFNASGKFESVDCQIAGLGEIEAIQNLYVAHTAEAMK